ncbi:MAG: hypothetical protein LAO18_09785 [Acidobacteriia bacterium]|nr:hypothetical protein [Terriglobia bacterium]
MKRWQFFVLIFELALFAAILVLPQVALPDFAFHGGTAPVAAHARVRGPARATAIAIAQQILLPGPMMQVRGETSEVSAPPPVHSRLSRLCVLIC